MAELGEVPFKLYCGSNGGSPFTGSSSWDR